MSSCNLVCNLPKVFLLWTKISECKFLFIAINVNVGAGRPLSQGEILSSLGQIFRILVVIASMCRRYEDGAGREIWNKINQRKFFNSSTLSQHGGKHFLQVFLECYLSHPAVLLSTLNYITEALSLLVCCNKLPSLVFPSKTKRIMQLKTPDKMD